MHRQIPELVSRMLAALPAAEAGTRFSSDALQTLMGCPWPGNVAELRRTVEGMAARLPGRTVRSADLPAALHSTARHRRLTLMETAERQAIVTALQHCGGNRSRAAAELGIGRTTLYRKMQQHHLTP
jgi:sigma-54 dependent transcriptional regulator, acetoin dehydrogenase operon transcriptional activator AcoR